MNGRPIGKDEIEEALGDLKVGKAPGLDEISPELLKCGGGGGVDDSVVGEGARCMLLRKCCTNRFLG